jgi:hypothetical protein
MRSDRKRDSEKMKRKLWSVRADNRLHSVRLLNALKYSSKPH